MIGKVNDIHLALMLDTGAQANVISFNKIRPKPNLHAAKEIVRGHLGKGRNTSERKMHHENYTQEPAEIETGAV